MRSCSARTRSAVAYVDAQQAGFVALLRLRWVGCATPGAGEPASGEPGGDRPCFTGGDRHDLLAGHNAPPVWQGQGHGGRSVSPLPGRVLPGHWSRQRRWQATLIPGGLGSGTSSMARHTAPSVLANQ